jgi:hypothetical protein
MADAISGAHIYGRPLVQAEAFTELREAWDEYPGMLKTLQDRNYALGINRMVFHVFTHNPWPDRKPGMTLGGVGTFLQRDQTWWPQARAWVDYTRRCQWLLQQGRPVADIAVFTGEELPRRAVLPPTLVSTLPGLFGAQRISAEKARLANTGEPTTKAPNGVAHSANMADPADWIDPLHGYAFDSFNPDALLRLATVRDGRIELPGGASYRLLVLPGATPMNPDPGAFSAPVAQKLLALVKAGATILIDPATNYHSNTLTNGCKDDSIVKAVFAQLLGTSTTHPDHGRGRVIIGPWQKPSLESIGIQPDVLTGSGKIAYAHRTTPDADIYFFSNQAADPIYTKMHFRTAGGVPLYLDPVTGAKYTLINWDRQHPHSLGVTLAAQGSAFIVIPRKPATARQLATFRDMGFMDRSEKQLTGPWSVQFDTAFGGPAASQQFDSLTSWSSSPDSNIHYYSGPAVYSTVFEWTKVKKHVYLDLGTVHDIATVTVNGRDCGTVWTANALDLSKAIRTGRNEVKITVTNTWNNRLTGDEHLPPSKRRTWTTAPKRPDGPLLPAGLLGPVRIAGF